MSADLGVTVTSPKRADSGARVTFKVRVANHGPENASYTLRLALSSRRATCSVPAWLGDHAVAELASGSSRSADRVVSCTKNRRGASVTVTARLLPVLADPVAANDTAVSRTTLR